MIRKYLKWHGHEVRTELGDCPHNRQALQFSGRVRLSALFRALEVQQMMRSLPSLT